MQTVQSNLGELVNLFYDEFMELYGDAELAAVAAAAVINDLITTPVEAAPLLEDAA